MSSQLNSHFRILILAVAVMLSINGISAKLVPRSVEHRHESHTLQQRNDNSHPAPVSPDYEGFRQRCEEGSDPKHPCFVAWDVNFKDILVYDPKTKADLKGQVLMKDGAYKDFTMKDPKTPFTLEYHGAGGARFTYENFDPSSGCYDITLEITEWSKEWRLWVRRQHRKNGADLDTLNARKSSTKFCGEKWLRFKLTNGGGGWVG